MPAPASRAAVRPTLPAPRWFIANRIRVLVDGAATGGAFDQVDMLGAHGDMPPLHVHRATDRAVRASRQQWQHR